VPDHIPGLTARIYQEAKAAGIQQISVDSDGRQLQAAANIWGVTVCCAHLAARGCRLAVVGAAGWRGAADMRPVTGALCAAWRWRQLVGLG
jgi:hypothetical protein